MAGPIDQFVVKPLIENADGFVIAGYDLTFTNSALWMFIAAFVSTLFFAVAIRKTAMVPGRLQMTAELLYEFVSKMVNENIGSKGRQYFPFVFTLFMFVLMGNILGLLPYSFTYTSHLIVTAALALFIFVMSIAIGLYNHGFKFLSLFLPPGVPWWLVPFIVPLELVSFFVRPLTHSVRLFANMMAGHLILKIVIGFSITAASAGGMWFVLGIFPALFNVVMMMFELLVAGIQAYVFAILACVYLKDSVDLHH